ncbi:MAG: PilZ domain-containing protein [Candidatus Korobacteraceae bacterium]
MTSTTTPKKARRGTKRVLLSVTLIASVKLGGANKQFKAETINVNREGAKIRTDFKLEVGLRIRVAVMDPYRFAYATVRWASPTANEYGVELESPGNFWGIVFPPDDWQEPALPLGGLGGRLIGGVLDSGHAGVPGSREQTAAVVPVPTIPAEGKSAILTGMSAVGLPFQEAGRLLPDGKDIVTMLVGPTVMPGVSLRVVMDTQVFKANIKAVSRHREAGKWRVWLRFR